VILGLLLMGFLAGCGSPGGPATEPKATTPGTQTIPNTSETEAPAPATATSYTDLQTLSPGPEFGITVDPNLKVVDIVPGEGADKAGVEVGDVLAALNGTALTSTTQAQQIVLNHIATAVDSGQALTLTVNRNGKAVNLPIRATPPIDRGGRPDKPLPTFTPLPAGYGYY
jgi:S1-C subfamily serine protease